MDPRLWLPHDGIHAIRGILLPSPYHYLHASTLTGGWFVHDLAAYLLRQALLVPQTRRHEATELSTTLQQNIGGLQHADLLCLPGNPLHLVRFNLMLWLSDGGSIAGGPLKTAPGPGDWVRVRLVQQGLLDNCSACSSHLPASYPTVRLESFLWQSTLDIPFSKK